MQLKELKVTFAQLAHEKEISNMNLVKKVEELSNVVEELRRVMMEKPVMRIPTKKMKGKKDVGEEVEEDEEKGEKEKDDEAKENKGGK
ncbi:hypothetical protein C1H46_031627 [Malus baccata]|uniref:Uncharacterized protein n=1 Tax=Malus baccata TaxID=106549 RepID=A0A540L8I1_MALBA|nr:hypothetical protein C1H46_031627 [Malus baccata]